MRSALLALALVGCTGEVDTDVDEVVEVFADTDVAPVADLSDPAGDLLPGEAIDRMITRPASDAPPRIPWETLDTPTLAAVVCDAPSARPARVLLDRVMATGQAPDLPWCTAPAWCDTVAEHLATLDGGARPRLRAWLLDTLGACPPGPADAVTRDPEAPASLRGVRLLWNQTWPAVHVDTDLLVAVASREEASWGVDATVHALLEAGHTDLWPLLRDAHARSEGEAADLLGVAAGHLPHPEAVALAERTCARLGADTPGCGHLATWDWADGRAIEDRVVGMWYDAAPAIGAIRRLRASDPDRAEAALDALGTCVSAGPGDTLDGYDGAPNTFCLLALAVLEPDRAVQAARAAPDHPSWRLQGRLVTWRAGGPAALSARLVEIGLLPAPVPDPPPSATPATLLLAGGVASPTPWLADNAAVDTPEGDPTPALGRVLALAGLKVQSAAVTRLDGQGRPVATVCLDTGCHEAPLAPVPIDGPGLAALANTLLDETGAAHRVAWLSGGNLWIRGTPEALGRARAEGLIRTAVPTLAGWRARARHAVPAAATDDTGALLDTGG